MYCSVCKHDTSPLKLTGDTYCSNCGTLYAASAQNAAPVVPAAAPKRQLADLAPRARTSVTHAATPSADTHPSAKPATAMHSRVKAAGVLDLRSVPAPSSTLPTITLPEHAPAPAPHTAVHERHLAHLDERLDRAKQVGRSAHISRFSGARAQAPTAPGPQPASPAASPVVSLSADIATAPSTPSAPVPTPAPSMPHHVAAQHAALSRLAPAATPASVPTAPAPKPRAGWRPHLKLSPHAGQVMATGTAVVILGSYIWLQNYPKLALQAANGRAGVTASLPGYLPSSYTLAHTDTAPGSVTLNFHSPSLPDALKIAQARTSWDASSLLDNFVIKNADDYSTVQGQGLTIYVFGQNHATWINHGIWYSIEGATKLSRDQLLKIAYSL